MPAALCPRNLQRGRGKWHHELCTTRQGVQETIVCEQVVYPGRAPPNTSHGRRGTLAGCLGPRRVLHPAESSSQGPNELTALAASQDRRKSALHTCCRGRPHP